MSANQGPASAGPFRVVLAILAVLALAVAPGCKVGRDKVKDTNGLPKGLSAKPQPLDPSIDTTTTVLGGSTSSTAPGSGGPGSTGTTAKGGGTATTRAGATPTTDPPPPFRTILDLADAKNDEGLQGTAYGDLIGLRVEDNGISARLTVSLAADVPAKLPSGETMGIGIDLFRGHKESDYQLFADGGPDGWLAYYSNGSGFKQFPGTFELGANKLVFTLPWSALGGRLAGTVSAFADWSKQGAVIASASEDHAPDQGSTGFGP